MIEEKLIAAGMSTIAGVDEAGRGACAGPLVVAATILKDPKSVALEEVRDSKELTAQKREELFDLVISESITYAIIEISPALHHWPCGKVIKLQSQYRLRRFWQKSIAIESWISWMNSIPGMDLRHTKDM